MRALAFVLLLSGCDCGGHVNGNCETTDDCMPGEECRDFRCVPRADAGPVDAGREPDAGQGCPSAVLCGTPAVCCDVGQECVDGACLAACPSSVRCGADLTT